jgi:hypothetical protein
MLAARGLFQRFSNRAALFAALALLMTYFDLLSGALLVTLSLGLVLNHLFYTRPQGETLEPPAYLKSICSQSAAIVACFLGGYVFLTGFHLALVSLVHDGALQAFRDGLAVRVSSSDGASAHVTDFDLAMRLWERRARLTPFGPGAATWFLLGSGVCWLLAAVTVWRTGRRAVYDFGLVAVAASGILAWYLLFTNHSFIHAWFAVRFLALPASYGFVAAFLVLEHVPFPNLFLRVLKRPEELTTVSPLPAGEG